MGSRLSLEAVWKRKSFAPDRNRTVIQQICPQACTIPTKVSFPCLAFENPFTVSQIKWHLYTSITVYIFFKFPTYYTKHECEIL
jgi:hypothetical protein